MVQTRGKPTRAFLHGGGAPREIEAATVEAVLAEHGLPADAVTVGALTALFNRRLAMIDAAPRTLRHTAEIREIAKAARALGRALGRSPAEGDIMLAMRGKFLETGWPYDERFLSRALAILADAEKHLMQEHRPAAGYHAAIREAHDVLAEAGGNVALHETSAFVLFLCGMDGNCPGLIFPPEAGTTARGRFRYVERVLKGH